MSTDSTLRFLSSNQREMSPLPWMDRGRSNRLATFEGLSLFTLFAILGLTALSPTAQAIDRVTEEKVGAALAKLESLVPDQMQKTGVPGIAIGVVYQNKPIFLKGYGVRDIFSNRPVDADTVFQLASVSKPLGSTVIAGLVGDGLVSWDDPIVKHLPDFAMDSPYVSRNVTLRDMYSHRSGLYDHAGDLLEDLGYERAEILYRLRFIPTANKFRARYAYTNFGVTAGGVAAAKAADATWAEICKERLYDPLGMDSTSSLFSDFAARSNRARGHVLVNGAWEPKYQRNPEAQSPAGGASSNVRDMVRWLRVHLGRGKIDGKPIVAGDALAETYRPEMVSQVRGDPAMDSAAFYGLGWNVGYDDSGHVELSHSGAFSMGAATTVRMLPYENIGIVVLTNAAPIGLAEALAKSFLDIAKFGSVQRDWFALYKQAFSEMAEEGKSPIDYRNPPKPARPQLAAENYVGIYRNDFFGDLKVAVNAGKLSMQLGPKQLSFILTHYDRDVFFYETKGESSVGLSGVTFSIGPQGKATRVVLENVYEERLGTFIRVP